MSNLFRKSSLEKLSSPEQLDTAIAITSPMSWMAIAGIVIIVIAFFVWALNGTIRSTVYSVGLIVNGKDTISVYSEYAGELTQSDMELGKKIYKGDVVGTIRAKGGMDTEITAGQSGRISSLLSGVGDSIGKYDVIAKMEPDSTNENVIITYIPADVGKTIRVGMHVTAVPVSAGSDNLGHINGEVISIDDYLTSEEDIRKTVGNSGALFNMLSSEFPETAIVIKPDMNDDSTTDSTWMAKDGREFSVAEGTIVALKIITSESTPIQKIFPHIYEQQ